MNGVRNLNSNIDYGQGSGGIDFAISSRQNAANRATVTPEIIRSKKQHHRILIVGGGTAGIITASLLRRAGQSGIALLDPSEDHFYQPIWTLVGAGEVRREVSRRREARYIPKGVHWIRDWAVEVDPETRYVRTALGAQLGYDVLILAPGIELDWDQIPGLREAIDCGNTSTNYTYDFAPRTWELIRNFRGGTALFHMPGGPIKCPGAPQKIMYLASDHFRRQGILKSAHVIFGSAGASIFGAPEYAKPLNQAITRYGIDARFKHELVEIRPKEREAVFQLTGKPGKESVTIQYDILHAVPPQRAPEFLRNSPVADPTSRGGWVEVDKFTLQHTRYANVFALGDAANTPNAKTGAAASKQAHVVAANVISLLGGRELIARYDGYIACPVVTAHGRMLLCELDYSGCPAPTIPLIDTFRERHDMWLLKKYGLPWLYWNVLLRGKKIPFTAKHRAAPSFEPVSA